jgi:hypothetical protein
MPENDEWLEQVREDALEPYLPFVGPHLHLWDRNSTLLRFSYFSL